MKKALTILNKVWKLVVLFVLVALTFAYAMFQGGFVSWFLFYSFLPFALYGLALSFYPLEKIKLERTLNKKEFHAGETLTINVTLTRKFPFPLFYLVIEECFGEQLTRLQKKASSKTLLFPHFRKEIQFQYVIAELPRGEHCFQNINVKTGDPLGLMEKERTIATSDQKIIVFPTYAELRYRPLDQQYDQGMSSSKERVQKDMTMVVGIREYQPGDRFSWINWKATAKRNDIMTKEFEQRQSHDVMIVMDCAPEKRFEVIVSFTASIIKAIFQKGAQVGFVSSALKQQMFPIRNDEEHKKQLSYYLATVKDDCPVTFDKVLDSGIRLQGQSGTMLLITAQLTEALIEKAGYLTARSNVVAIFVLKNEQELATANEISLRTAAKSRGVHVDFIYDGHFSDAFSGVNRR